MDIRKGKFEDMKLVLGLIQEFVIFEKELDVVLIIQEDLICDGFGENLLFYVFVVEVEKEIVGIVLYYYRYFIWKGKIIYFEDLIVKEKMRGMGLGFVFYFEIMK